MPRNLKIALVQFNPLPPDHSHDAHEQNLAKAHNFVRDAAKQGAQLIVFPEYFLSGGELATICLSHLVRVLTSLLAA